VTATCSIKAELFILQNNLSSFYNWNRIVTN